MVVVFLRPSVLVWYLGVYVAGLVLFHMLKLGSANSIELVKIVIMRSI